MTEVENKSNAPNTYVPELIGKEWRPYGAREIEDALRRLTLSYDTLLLRLAAAGVNLDGLGGGSGTFYQEVSEGTDAPVVPRNILSFSGPGLTVEDVGDRTVVTTGAGTPGVGGTGGSEVPAFPVLPIEIYAVRDVLAKTYR